MKYLLELRFFFLDEDSLFDEEVNELVLVLSESIVKYIIMK